MFAQLQAIRSVEGEAVHGAAHGCESARRDPAGPDADAWHILTASVVAALGPQ